MAAPTLLELKLWLDLEAEDTQDDVVLTESLDAALAAQAAIVDYPLDDFGEAAFVDDLRVAIFVRTQRLASRRNSPEGVVGISGAGGDFVGARLPSGDPDVLRLE